jgi:C4-dicarboxylate transporter DctM subunit
MSIATRQAEPTGTDARVTEGRPSGSPVPVFAALVLSVLLAAAVLVLDLPRPAVGLLCVALVLSLIGANVHVGIAMIAAGGIGLYTLGGPRVMAGSLSDVVFASAASWQLSVIPMFIFMGMMMWKSGLTAAAYSTARLWLGRLPGGLAIATNFAGAGLAASSGSSIGISYALGRSAIPEMLKAGYRPSLATGTVAAAGTLGQLIPPSVMLVLYAGIAQTPVGPQLLASVVPGVLVACAFGAMITGWVMLRPASAPRLDLGGVTWGQRLRALKDIIPVAIVVLVVIGGILGGVLTATEAAAFGALASVAVAWTSVDKGERSGRKRLKLLGECLVQTAGGTAAIFLLVIGVMVLTRLVTLSRLSQELSQLVADLGLSRVTLLLLLIVVYLVLGMFLDPLASMLLTIPVLTEPLAAVGVDMLWFGVFMVLMAEVAFLSPPIGMLSFIVHKLAQEPEVNLGKRITLLNVFAGVLPFVVVTIAMAILLIFVPDLALWLPGWSAGE